MSPSSPAGNGRPAANGRATRKRTGGEIVCDVLLEEGSTVVFGMPGGASLPFYDALYHYQDRIRHVLCRHEQGAGFAANGWARATGKAGVATSTSGPGATNLVTCMANDMMDSVPVVYITGQVSRPAIGSDAFQETDITGITIPITKHNYLVLDVNELPRVMKEAFYLATTGRPGPVHVDIPKDVFLASTDAPTPASIELRGYRPAKAGHALAVRRAAEAINAAERPIIMAGHGIVISGAASELLQLAEKARIPVITTLHGVGTFPESHALSYGMLGMHGMAYANYALAHTDCVIGLGVRFDDRATGKVEEFAKAAKIVHIDIDPAEIGKVLKTDFPIVGDLKLTLRDLIPHVETRERTAWHAQMEQWRADHPSLRIPDSPDSVLPQETVRMIYEISRGAARVVADVGQNQMWAAQHYWYERPREFFSAGGLGPMGYALPAAMGVQIADPTRKVWCITGDGGVLINVQEFNTLAAERIPVKVAILNNAHLGMIRQWQEFFYGGRLMGAHLDNPDFAKVAEAFGLRGISARTRDEMHDAIAAAYAYDGPVVLDLHVDRVESVYPMVVPGTPIGAVVEDPR
ncbi:MAG: biosynthetic-type acetolactate synthase large subunit [Actinobacteria bacterium]|nr:biosynthetic-type acetolactate synthase large subunit [Actinomycetota bacterium]